MATQTVSPHAPTQVISLRDTVLGLISLMASQGRTRVPITEFFKIFGDLHEKFSSLLPPMLFTHTAHSAYSKQLDDALQSLVGYSVELPNPTLQCIELQDQVAKRHLIWLEKKFGRNFIDCLEPFARSFLAELDSNQRTS